MIGKSGRYVLLLEVEQDRSRLKHREVVSVRVHDRRDSSVRVDLFIRQGRTRADIRQFRLRARAPSHSSLRTQSSQRTDLDEPVLLLRVLRDIDRVHVVLQSVSSLELLEEDGHPDGGRGGEEGRVSGKWRAEEMPT